MHFMGLLVIHTMAIEMTKEPWDEAKVKITGSAVTHHHGNYARAVHGPGELFHLDPRAIRTFFCPMDRRENSGGVENTASITSDRKKRC